MPTVLEPLKGKRDGFEQILNWIGVLKVQGEDVDSLEQDVLRLERLTQDINSEDITKIINNRLLEWLELIQWEMDKYLGASLVISIDGSSSSSKQIEVKQLHENIKIIISHVVTISQLPERENTIAEICDLIATLEPIKRDSEEIEFYKASTPLEDHSLFTSHLWAIFRSKNALIQSKKLSWLHHEQLSHYQYQWQIFIRFSGQHHRSTTVSKIIWLLSEALESVSGVVVEIEEQGVGSIWYKLQVFFANLCAREEVLDLLEKTRDAAIAEADKRIEGVENLRAQTLKTEAEAATIERQSELIPDSEEAKKIRDLDIKKKELEIREKEADIKKKELENYKATLDLVQQMGYMMKEGLLQAAPVEIQINGQDYLKCQDGQFLSGVEMKAIDERTLVKPEDGELQPPE